ncbi:MAG: SDR family NAD(P)-dependent oxidoreductase [Marinilabiliales bacterium]|nr:SDR family NAD(P)-dependent oxidoreductase [Marinilabiliales bacterium]
MKKVILITGISSGFGKETASLLAKAGHTVYGTLRKETETDPLVHVLKMDLSDSQSIRDGVKTLLDKEGRIDVLINNAGMHTGGASEMIPIETIRLQMQTNFLGMVELTQLLLPTMRAQGSGTLINFGSIGGLMGLPFQGIYSAGKFAIEGFSAALRMELRQFGIKVVVINPGDFHTHNSANRRGFLYSLEEGNPYQTQFAKTLELIEKDENGGWKPEILAKKLVKIVGCRNPRQRYVIASAEQKLAVVLNNILPDKLFDLILRSHYGIK